MRGGWRARALVAVLVAGTAAAAAVPASAVTSTVAVQSDATLQTNGRVRAILTVGAVTYVGGAFTSVRPAGAPAGTGEVPRSYLAAFDATTGALLQTWSPAANKEVYSLAASPDGATIYVGGLFSAVGGQPRARLAAVSASTGALLPFRADADNKVFALHATATTLYAGGSFTAVGGVARSRAAALDPITGAVSTAWKPAADGTVMDIAPSPDGAVLYLGGAFGSVNGLLAQKRLAKVDATTGALLPWRTRPGYPVWSIVATADHVYVGGDGSGGHAGRFTSSGVREWTTQTDGGVQGIALIDDVVYLGGHFDNVCVGDTAGATTGFTCPSASAVRHKLMAVDAATGATDPWDPGANSTLGVFALTGFGGKVQVGGDFTRIGRVPGKTSRPYQQGFAQFSPSPGPVR